MGWMIAYWAVAAVWFLLACYGTKKKTEDESFTWTMVAFVLSLIWPLTAILTVGMYIVERDRK